MSEQRAKIAMDLAEHDGNTIVAHIKSRVQSFETEEEKIIWWASFMAYLGGLCAAELGSGALSAIKNMTADMAKRVVEEQAH